jgi:hypothetical protein
MYPEADVRERRLRVGFARWQTDPISKVLNPRFERQLWPPGTGRPATSPAEGGRSFPLIRRPKADGCNLDCAR